MAITCFDQVGNGLVVGSASFICWGSDSASNIDCPKGVRAGLMDYEFLERLIVRFGLWRVISAPLVVMAGLASFAALFGDPLVGFLVAFVVLFLSAVILLTAAGLQIKKQRTQLGETDRLLRLLREHVTFRTPATFEIDLWRDEAHVRKNGDVRRISSIKLTVTGDSPLHFIQLFPSGEALRPKEQHKIRATVRLGEDGARLLTQSQWADPKRMIVWAYLASPVSPGSTILLVLEYEWPRSFARLVSGEVDRFHWMFSKSAPKRIEYHIILDSKMRLPHDVKISKEGLKEDPQQRTEVQGLVIEGAEDMPPVGERIGIALDAGPKG